MKRKPPQGTHSIFSQKKKAIVENSGANMADAYILKEHDKDLNELYEAKKNRDFKKVGELLNTLRPKYGEKTLSKLYKSF